MVCKKSPPIQPPSTIRLHQPNENLPTIAEIRESVYSTYSSSSRLDKSESSFDEDKYGNPGAFSLAERFKALKYGSDACNDEVD